MAKRAVALAGMGWGGAMPQGGGLQPGQRRTHPIAAVGPGAAVGAIGTGWVRRGPLGWGRGGGEGRDGERQTRRGLWEGERKSRRSTPDLQKATARFTFFVRWLFSGHGLALHLMKQQKNDALS